jgi:SAM-dependent methyltransferase
MVALAAFQGGEEEAWQRFLKWLPTVPPSDNPGSLVQLYRSHLLAGGKNPAEAERELAAIFKLMRARTDGWQVIFNRIYASPKPGFSIRPNALLVSAVEGREPGRALDAGMGQGRNSVFLAIKGWEVSGFDVSDEGLAIARRDAERAGVKVNAVLKSHDAFDYGTAEWDLIVITYEPFPVTDADYVRRLGNALRPGGLIVIESFASESSAQGRRPVDIDPAELRRTFAEFRIVRFEDAEEVPDWDPKKTRLVRMVAEKKR